MLQLLSNRIFQLYFKRIQSFYKLSEPIINHQDKMCGFTFYLRGISDIQKQINHYISLKDILLNLISRTMHQNKQLSSPLSHLSRKPEDTRTSTYLGSSEQTTGRRYTNQDSIPKIDLTRTIIKAIVIRNKIILLLIWRLSEINNYYNQRSTFMTNQLGKIVQNYCLQQLKSTNADFSQIWTAKHKILKKNFTLKRVKWRANQIKSDKEKSSENLKEQWDVNNITRQTNLLKRLSSEMIPKCHKMIKTSNNIYLVYDQFPSISLENLIRKSNLPRQEKLDLMMSVAQSLSYFHKRGIILIHINITNIFVRDKKDIFFSDWSLARPVENVQIINPLLINQRFIGLAPQVKNGGKYFYWTDIYSLGIIFQEILSSGQEEQPSNVDQMVEKMIQKMLSVKGDKRVTLIQVITLIQSCFNILETSKDTWLQIPESKITHVNSKLKIKYAVSTPQQPEIFSPKIYNKNLGQSSHKLSLFESPTKNQPYITLATSRLKNESGQIQIPERKFNTQKNLQRVKSFDINSLNIITHTRKKIQVKQNLEILVKKINKRRNLAFFIMELSQFVVKMQQNLELAYILLKYSYLTLSSALVQWQKNDDETDTHQKLLFILKQEQEKLAQGMLILKNIFAESLPSQRFKKQLQRQGQISDRFLKEKIIDFSKEIILKCGEIPSDKNSQLLKLIDCLFRTYMMLKKIEQGSFEKFWDKIYINEKAFLQNQRYFKQQKNLGFRYLKSRIIEILSIK